MQRAAGERFVCSPDSSNDQRGKRTYTEKELHFLRFPLWNPLWKVVFVFYWLSSWGRGLVLFFARLRRAERSHRISTTSTAPISRK